MNSSSQNKPDASTTPQNNRVPAGEPMEIENEPTILTLDQSTQQEIPCHLQRLLTQLGARPTQFDCFNVLVVALGLETGFIGGWCCPDNLEDAFKDYSLNPNYSFDRRLVKDFARLPQPTDAPSCSFTFRFALKPDSQIYVHSLDVGDDVCLTSYANVNSVITSTHSLTLPISRYIIHRRFNSQNLPENFRNLRELSIKVKENIFLPLRNKIFYEASCGSLSPSLQAMPESFLLKILKYLKVKDVAALKTALRLKSN